MTYALIDTLTTKHEATAREFAAAGHTDPTHPRATAILDAFFFWKLYSEPEAAEIPLEELVTPASLATWEAIFANPMALADTVAHFRHLGIATPRVRPQPDGSLVIPLPWVHPDQDEPLEIREDTFLPTPYVACLELVHEPDDWRVHSIEPRDEPPELIA
ncbi:MAG: hypothetical protein ACYDCS_04125 [Candidatus Dormibacteria bacterium]